VNIATGGLVYKMDSSGRTARLVHLGKRLRHVGPRQAAARLAYRAYSGLHVETIAEHVRPDDVVDSGSLRLQNGPARLGPATIGWICAPPGVGSGGHTTLFRMVEAAERRGHRCVIFLYDVFGGDFDRHRAMVHANWPRLRAEIRDANQGIAGVDGCVASSWQSAHALAAGATTPTKRLYFIQDYEPYFYPHGSLYALAEDTYRFGFRCIALGQMVADTLQSEVGTSSDVVPFACDTAVYGLGPTQPRSGVVFFTRPEVPRRGFIMGALALEQFHRLRPEQEIHLYGDRRRRDLAFPHTNHGLVSPAALNDLYNRTITGLALSFTNVTLVAEEMLAAGNVPVANDDRFARAVLRNPHVLWADPTPGALAAALTRAVDHKDLAGRAAAVSRSVATSWSVTQERVVDLIEDELTRVS